MVIDSSALMAITMREPERFDFLQKIQKDAERLISAVCYQECSMLMFSRKGQTGLDEFDALCKRLRLELVAADEEQVLLARYAFVRFGKGHHPAKLNLADCFSYALARWSSEPLLFKGDDFSKTDLQFA